MSSRRPRLTLGIATVALLALIATSAVASPATAAPPPDKGKPSPSATPTPDPTEPAPAPSEPTEPTAAPTEPPPTEPTTTPTEPATPTPTNPAPAPTEAAPTPTESAPSQPAPAPETRTLIAPTIAYPRVMAAAGDSITLAYNSAGYGSFPQYSWSTGSASTLNSLRQRLQTASATTITAANVAQVGANSASLAFQVTSAIAKNADYLTVEIGANDACTPTTIGMTSEADYRARIAGALSQFLAAKTDSKVFVASIPNLYRMWSLSKGKFGARLIWASAKICQSMLVRPTSALPADENRRLEVQARVNAYNAILQDECGKRAPRCTFDNNATANYQFTSTHISTADYFHPSIEGQRVLATITWASNPYK